VPGNDVAVRTRDIGVFTVLRRKEASRIGAKKRATRNKSSDISEATRAPRRLRANPSKTEPARERERKREREGGREMAGGKNFSYLRASLFPRAAAYGYQTGDVCDTNARTTRSVQL